MLENWLWTKTYKPLTVEKYTHTRWRLRRTLNTSELAKFPDVALVSILSPVRDYWCEFDDKIWDFKIILQILSYGRLNYIDCCCESLTTWQVPSRQMSIGFFKPQSVSTPKSTPNCDQLCLILIHHHHHIFVLHLKNTGYLFSRC